MPGFNVGGSSNAGQKSNVAEPRRKHRWLITALSTGTGVVLTAEDLVYLQKAARPQFKYDAKEMHHDQEEAWYAGKQHWDPVGWEFYDVEDPDISNKMRAYFNKVTENFNDPGVGTSVAHPRDYKGEAKLAYYGGGGSVTEEWRFLGIWPAECNWNDLDYASTELQTISATMRYDKAVGEKKN